MTKSTESVWMLKKWNYDRGLSGSYFPYGSTEIATLQDGTFLFSHDYKDEAGWGCEVRKYKFDNGEFTEI